ncbi:hypothetical protein [Puia sp.]|uniref:hypothetical protein n=1 Tax=Puia sp. TaxID=2045100 RepID=UPI002F3EDEB3
MRLKLTPIYILSFLCLTFFVMEIHEWAHTAAAALVSGKWGPHGFDRWEFAAGISASNGQRAVATLAGPIINFLVIWIGWIKMANRESLADQSLGCNLVLAALPMGLLIAAVSGGGDLTIGLKLLFSRMDRTYPHLIAVIALLIILIIAVPPLIRIFILLPSWGAKFIYFPLFLFAPIWVHHHLTQLLDSWLRHYEPDEGLAYAWVLFWDAVLLGGWLFTRRRLEALLKDSELPL